uniref:hepatic lectin-like n=1 Tax=Pristiophorus japonicus TaxID=55135 RepID=UPI00398E8E19
MELDDYQTLNNFRPDRLRGDRGTQEALKPEHGVRSAEPVRGKQSSLVIYILLGLSILLSVVILGTAVILYTEISSKVSSLREDTDNLRKKLCLNLSDSQCTHCATGWKYFGGKCYYFSSSVKDWNAANMHCFSTRSHLIVIDTKEEQNFMSGNIMNQHHWIGLSDLSVEGQWHWVDGTDNEATGTFWAPGEPNNDGKNEHCAQTLNNGQWNDEPCSFTYKWICERPSFSYFLN